MPEAAPPPPAPSPAAVVVATRDRPTMLERCLDAVVGALRPGDRVVVVDSASADPAVRRVAEQAGAEVLRLERPGTCRARNAGWLHAGTDVVLFTDDDCTPAADWVAVTAGLLDRCPAVDFVTGGVHPGAAPARRAQLQTSLLTATCARDLLPGRAGDLGAGGGTWGTFGHGANMAWRRTALQRIGGFDESLGPGAAFRGAEDRDAFSRALRLGCRGRFEPASVVVHHQWRDRRGQLRAHFGYGMGAGACQVKRWRLQASPADGTRVLSRRQLARLAGRTIVWEDGVAAATRSLLDHFEMAAVGAAVTMAGELAGAVRARRAPLDELGRFVAP